MVSVYVTMCGDILHSGHINMIERAAKLGDVTVGLLSDEAVAAYKRVTFMSFEERYCVVSALGLVKNVVAQVENTPKENLLRLRPDVFVHGDDWKHGNETWVRDLVIETLNSYGGRLIEFPYTENISSTDIQTRAKVHRASFHNSAEVIRRSLQEKSTTRGILIEGVQLLSAAADVADQRKEYNINWLHVRDIENFKTSVSHDLLKLVLTGSPVAINFSSLITTSDIKSILPFIARIGASMIALPAAKLTEIMQQTDWRNVSTLLQEFVVCAHSITTNEISHQIKSGQIPVSAVILDNSDNATQEDWPSEIALGVRVPITAEQKEETLQEKGFRMVIYDGRGMTECEMLTNAENILQSISHTVT